MAILVRIYFKYFIIYCWYAPSPRSFRLPGPPPLARLNTIDLVFLYVNIDNPYPCSVSSLSLFSFFSLNRTMYPTAMLLGWPAALDWTPIPPHER